MKTYTVDQAFKLLEDYKITTQEESVRRWLREGTIQGIAPRSRKEGWMIPGENLFAFIQSRMPDDTVMPNTNATNVVNNKEDIRAEMWWELVRKNLFEGAIEVKKTFMRQCVDHMELSKTFETYAWELLQEHKRGYAMPRIPYLLDAALFDGHRILLDTNFESIEEQVMFAVLEYIRQKKTAKS